MNTKFLHLGIASAIAATMGLAQAQTSPASGAIIRDAAPVTQPAELSSRSAPSVTSDGVPGISNESPSTSGMTSNPDWNHQNASSVSHEVPADSLANVDARRNQSVQSNDGMNIPPAFAPGSPDENSRSR